jgi:ferritin
MIGQKIQEAFNKQINAELYSAYLYLSMGAWFESANLRGAASWMRVQAREEAAHAMRFFEHVNERGGRVLLAPVDGPPTEWDSPLAAFEAVYAHEQKVTGMIHDLVDLAAGEADHAAAIFLQWFVNEQVEEESSAEQIVRKLEFIGDSRNGLLMIDRELGQRGAE